MMPFLIKFCPMELNLQGNVKEKIVVPLQGGLVEHAQKRVPVVSNLFVVFSSYLATLHFFANTVNIEFEICCSYLVFSLQRLGLTKILVVNFVT